MQGEFSDLLTIEDLTQFETNDLETLLHRVLNYLKHTTQADAGSIYLKEDNSLKYFIFQNDSFSYETIFRIQAPLKKMRFPIEQNSKTIAVESFISRKIIKIDDLYENDSFEFLSVKEFDEKYNYKTKSILTAPLINFQNDEVIGVLQLINKKNDDDQVINFSLEDKEFLSLSSYLITMSILTTQSNLEEMQELNEKLENNLYAKTKILENIQQQLLEQINKDPMTNLFNKKYFNDVGPTLLKLLKQNAMEISIIFFDIDDFKKINDTYGHFSGDEVIRHIGNLLNKITRNSDICIRFGGEEFVIILPNTTLENGVMLANKIRYEIENLTVLTHSNDKIQFTISAGVTQVESSDTSLDIATEKADKLLYEAKKAGKNQVKF